MENGILAHIQSMRAEARKGFAVLVDPDKVEPRHCAAMAREIAAAGAEMILVGGSLLVNEDFREVVPALRSAGLPVVLFPGHVSHLTPEADALFFLSLISGRNPDLLIGQHVVAAPHLKRSGIEVIPTGYMLIESGTTTAAHYVSQTPPIPREKSDIAACTAMAGELLGLRLIYMDAGSGAEQPIPTDMIATVRRSVDLPMVVGGGIRDAATAEATLRAGADLIVVGNALEQEDGGALMRSLHETVRSFRQTV